MPITKESIVKASLDILNRDGISNLTMRTLAKELEIKAASLYWHIKDKQDLYNLISEHINKEIVLPEEIDDPKEALTNLALEIRRVLLDTRDSVEVFSQSMPTTPSRLKAVKFTIDSLSKYGVSDKNCLVAGNLFNNYVMSFIADEQRAKHISFSPEEVAAFTSFLGEKYQFGFDFKEQFLYGLRVLFTGLVTD
ncbi:TetR/AcrR family transcriptional regulator C-terminal domain-containing protein [Bacillus sp. EAC]|uniref:TetR/AcrR family transcriptional regulator C-terminal domain-containing protein n=1 Tax=Bacillus sp. EAC TaxID=1978338 RepID=UPI000B43997B|nr:TetR/AcrR family transcriptional regulator C-terminal domain-containing protein [Bacillus sp. EAC]